MEKDKECITDGAHNVICKCTPILLHIHGRVVIIKWEGLPYACIKFKRNNFNVINIWYTY